MRKIRLEARRVDYGLSPAELAREMKVTEETVLRWEHDVRAMCVGDLLDLANFYKCGLEDIWIPPKKEGYIS